MAKTKTPFLSMGASGSVGKSITAQKLGNLTTLREKPFPAYRKTLLQLYVRHIYRFYAHLWTLQTSAIKQTFQSAGSRYHLTGLQWWMSLKMEHLPDIAAWLKLDDDQTATIYDSSKQGNTGTRFGATRQLISTSPTLPQLSAFYFDGSDDYITVANSPSLNFGLNDFSLEALIQTASPVTAFRKIVNMDNLTTMAYGLQVSITTGLFQAFITLNSLSHVCGSSPYIADNKLHYVTGTFNRAGSILTYIDGSPSGWAINIADHSNFNCSPQSTLYIGRRSPGTFKYTGLIGQVRLTNRLLDPTEIALTWKFIKAITGI